MVTLGFGGVFHFPPPPCTGTSGRGYGVLPYQGILKIKFRHAREPARIIPQDSKLKCRPISQGGVFAKLLVAGATAGEV